MYSHHNTQIHTDRTETITESSTSAQLQHKLFLFSCQVNLKEIN